MLLVPFDFAYTYNKAKETFLGWLMCNHKQFDIE